MKNSHHSFPKYLVLGLVFLFFNKSLKAQYGFLLHKPYSHKVEIIDTLYARIVSLDSVSALNEIAHIEKFGKENNDRETELEAELLRGYYYVTLTEKLRISNEADIDRLLQIAEKGNKEKYLHIEARALRVLAEYYWRWTGNYEMAFETYLKLNDLISTTNAQDFPNLAEYYYLIGEPYFFFKDYENTMVFMRKTLAIPETKFNWKAKWSANNTMGLCYQRLKNIDSSNYYFHKAIASSFVAKSSLWYSIVKGNIAQNLFDEKKYDEALPLIIEDYNNADKNINEYSLAANAAMLIADIYIKRNEKQVSENWLNKAIDHIKNAERPYELLPQYYAVKSSWYTLNGNIDKAKLYLDSTIIAKDILNEKLNAVFVLRAEQRAFKNKIETEQQNLILTKKIKNTQLIAAIVIIVLLMVFAMMIYTIQRKRRMIEAQISKAKLDEAEQQLHDANAELLSIKTDIVEKNKLIEKLSINSEVNNDVIEELRKTSILTNDDWENFRHAFEKVHIGFIDRLKHMINDITPSEIRMMVLSKLNLSKKEMAGALGISPQSLRVTWHRLRKKTDIPEDTDMISFADSI